MPIPEAQLQTWSVIGSITQSAATYKTISDVLSDAQSPYHSRTFKTFLQGSYGNHTNVVKDSDVDIVMCLQQTYYADLQYLTESAKANYQRAFDRAPYGYTEFKAEVTAWLVKNFGEAVKPGKKAIFIKGNGNRRDADVLVCSQHRRYRADSNGVDNNYDEGIVFWLSNGTEIHNFPKQHSDNCTEKQQQTQDRFKPLVRIYKNMRNRMIEESVIRDGLAPSYYLEGMIWNAPASKFGRSWQDSFTNTFDWVNESEKENLLCANTLHWLLRENQHVCWEPANFRAYMAAAEKFWNEWR